MHKLYVYKNYQVAQTSVYGKLLICSASSQKIMRKVFRSSKAD